MRKRASGGRRLAATLRDRGGGKAVLRGATVKRENAKRAFSGPVRWTGFVIVVALVAAIAAGVSVYLRQRSIGQGQQAAFGAEVGPLALAGLAAPVEILRDARGVPHIQAIRENDAWLSLGFSHAQDRLAQMLWLRRLAQGRTSEVLGVRGLQADRMARTLGIAMLAETQAERLDADTRSILASYAAGVNGRIERLRARHTAPPLALAEPVESIEDWRPADSIAVLKLIAWSSSNLIETGIVLDDLIERLGSQLALPFRPTGAGVRGVEVAGDLSPEDIARTTPTGPVDEVPEPSRDLVLATSIHGGTGWVLGGPYSESGSPILVADLHLPPTAPSLLYEVHLRGGGLDLAGVTIPGMPMIWAGRNLHVAWAAIPARAVTVDLYKETIRFEDGLYQNGSRWVPLEERVEEIRVKTPVGFDTLEWPVRATRHGPLIDPLLHPSTPDAAPLESSSRADASRPRREPLALAWTGAVPGDGVGPLLRIAHARGRRDVLSALAQHHEPVVSVVHVDERGRAGIQLAGWLPRRSLPTSLVPVPGRLRLFDWREPIAFDALPSLAFDASLDASGSRTEPGFVAIADGQIGNTLPGTGIEWLWRVGETQDRVERLLDRITSPERRPVPAGRGDEGPRRVDIRAALAIQQDVGGRAARDVVPPLLRLALRSGPLRPEAAEIADLLAAWNGVSDPGSRGAAAYQLLLEHLSNELFRAPFGDDLYVRYRALPGVRPAAVLASIIVAADRVAASGGWTDADRVTSAVRNALRRTWVSLSHRLGAHRPSWNWGRLHRLTFFSFVGLDRVAAPDLRTIEMGGDASTVAFSGFEPDRGFAVASASTFRMAVDLATPDQLLTSLAPGQSEHPGHPHYGDGFVRWLEGRPSLLLTSRLLVEEEAGETLLLEPAQ
jgi:penicillin amidase